MITIEVTGNSIAEVADKLLAVGNSLRRTAINDADDAAREALQAKRRATPKKLEEVVPEEPKKRAKEPEAEELSFDKDVAPFVLQVVKEKGKPAAQEILSQFGVERASLLEPSHWPELVRLLKEQL